MRLFFFLICGLFLFNTTAYSQTYRWVDENGVVSYSQTPPSSGQAEIITIKSYPKSESAEATGRLNNLRQQLEDSREDKELSKDTSREEAEKSAQRQQNCTAARANLQQLEGLGNRLLRTPDGQYVRLSEEERQSRMQTARDNIKAHCNH